MKYYKLADESGDLCLFIKTNASPDVLKKIWAEFFYDDSYESNEEFFDVLKKEGYNAEKIIFAGIIVPD